MLTSKENNNALEKLNIKLLEIMNDRGVLASDILSPSSKITNRENSIQFNLLKDSNSNRVKDMLTNNTIPVTLCETLSTYRGTCKMVELKGDLSKMITNRYYYVDLASLWDEKLMYDFAEQLYFDVKAPGNKSNRGRTLIEILKSPAITASGISTIISSENPIELCDR